MVNEQQQLSFARIARDEGIAAIESNDALQMQWIPRALAMLSQYPESEATGEDIRLWLCERIGNPHHHNATGAMVRQAIKAGILVKTGEWRNTKTKASHARMTPVYRVGQLKGGAQ